MIDCSGQRRSLIDILTSSTSRTDLTHTRTQQNRYTIKPANAITSIKHSPVLKGHIFLDLS